MRSPQTGLILVALAGFMVACWPLQKDACHDVADAKGCREDRERAWAFWSAISAPKEIAGLPGRYPLWSTWGGPSEFGSFERKPLEKGQRRAPRRGKLLTGTAGIDLKSVVITSNPPVTSLMPTVHLNAALFDAIQNNKQAGNNGWLVEPESREDAAKKSEKELELKLGYDADYSGEPVATTLAQRPIAVKPQWFSVDLASLCAGSEILLPVYDEAIHGGDLAKPFPAGGWPEHVQLDFGGIANLLSGPNDQPACKVFPPPQSKSKWPVWKAKRLVHFQVGAAQGGPDFPGSAGTMKILVAVHIAIRDRQDWTWNTYYWHPRAKERADGADFPFAGEDWAGPLSEQLNSFCMRTIHVQSTPKDPRRLIPMFDPYLENNFTNAALSNCLNCHRLAALGKAPAVRGCMVPITAEAKPFVDEKSMLTDYLWSLTRPFDISPRWDCKDFEGQ